jgi:hypothetical protein
MNIHDHIPELRAACLERPDSFAMFDKRGRAWFEPGGWGFSPIGTHRGADTLTRSNWQVITKDLLARFPAAFEVYHTSHWAVGWYDHLAVDTSNDGAMAALAEWTLALADYPCADESHWSELEWNEAHEYWERMSVADRLDAIEHSGARCSRFAARRDTLPSDDSGGLLQWLNK